jgi:hypothetical protein
LRRIPERLRSSGFGMHLSRLTNTYRSAWTLPRR